MHLRLPSRGSPKDIAVHFISAVRSALKILRDRLHSNINGNVFNSKGNTTVFFSAAAGLEHNLEEAKVARALVRNGPGQFDGNRDHHCEYDRRAVQYQHPIADRTPLRTGEVVIFQLRQNCFTDAEPVFKGCDQ